MSVVLRRSFLACGFAAAAAASSLASACGVCIEDRIAVAYDHAVVTRAAAQRHVVVFAAIDGVGGAGGLARDARAAAVRVRGVDRESVRIGTAPAGLSFALDPRVQTPEAALAAVERGAVASGLRLTMLKVIR